MPPYWFNLSGGSFARMADTRLAKASSLIPRAACASGMKPNTSHKSWLSTVGPGATAADWPALPPGTRKVFSGDEDGLVTMYPL
jgi:hypothetical protein